MNDSLDPRGKSAEEFCEALLRKYKVSAFEQAAGDVIEIDEPHIRWLMATAFRFGSLAGTDETLEALRSRRTEDVR